MAPVGIKYSVGSLFLHPELGFGYNTGNTSLDTYYMVDGNIIIGQRHKNLPSVYGYNKLSVPLFFTIGHEIQGASMSYSFGLKSYYALTAIDKRNHFPRHAYGVGFMLGVSM